jgi:hypothetical protein
MIGGHVVMPRTNAGRASTDCSGLLQLRACWHHRCAAATSWPVARACSARPPRAHTPLSTVGTEWILRSFHNVN